MPADEKAYTPPQGWTVINSYATPQGCGAEEICQEYEKYIGSYHCGMKRMNHLGNWEFVGYNENQNTNTVVLKWIEV
jgi:hypothetical protein